MSAWKTAIDERHLSERWIQKTTTTNLEVSEMILPADIERGVWRGKAKLDGSWVYGDLHHSLEDPDAVFIFDYEAKEWILVDPTTLGEFTTIRDKNGTPIFEGDIVGNGDEVFGVVKWDRHLARFYIDGEMFGEGIAGFYVDTDVEVVGNIYDNPKLIGGQGDESRKA